MTELEMLRRLAEKVNQLMLEAEDEKNEYGCVSLSTETLSEIWEQIREYNEFMGPGGEH